MPDLPPATSLSGTPTWASRTRLRIGRSTLAVRDLELVAAFYREVIGLTPVEGATDGVLLGSGGVGFLELLHRPEFRPDDPATAGLFHNAFLLPTRHDLARWLRHATGRGQRLDGASDHLVSEAIYLSDPEGNGIEVYADRAREDWGWQGGTVRMATIRLDLPALLASLDTTAAPWTAAPEGTRIGHVHLRVGDAAAAERFYADRVHLDVTAHYPNAVFLSADGYHHHLAANAWHSAGAGTRDPAMAGLVAVTLETTEPPAVPVLHDPWGTEIRLVAAAG